MNYRNLLFFIVLIFVWIAGYYYYWPEKATVNTDTQSDSSMQSSAWPQFDETLPEIPSINEYPLLSDSQNDPKNIDTTLSSVITDDRPEVSTPEPSAKHIKKRKKKQKKNPEQSAMDAPINTVPAAAEESQAPARINNDKKRSVTITSGLIKKDIGYYKMLSWHYPHLFNLTVNDQPIFTKNNKVISSAEIKIPADQPIVIRYSYEWHTPWGKRIGAKKVTFQPDPQATQLIVRFTSNWKNEERIIVDGATKITPELLEEESI